MSLPSYTVWFRGRPACPCLAEWIPAFEHELMRRGIITAPLYIYQLIGGADASAGTHAQGGAIDDNATSDAANWVARQMGADASWTRLPPAFTVHAHRVLRGCPHNGPAAYQITAVDAGYNGLGSGGMGGEDDGPRPLSGRTWRQGIEWARQQEEDDMPTPEEIADAVWARAVNDISGETLPAGRMLAQIHNRGAKALAAAQRISDGLAQLEDQVKDDATKSQVHRLRRELGDLTAALTDDGAGDDTPHA